ncbi:MAG: Cache 3/Cache 2 fusion domain-containing protein [Candidatus Omnitrophota bacterium]
MQLSKMVVCAAIVLSLAAGAASVATAEDFTGKVKEAMAELQSKTGALGVAKLDGDVFSFGSTEMNGNFDVVDEVAEARSCTATVFAKRGSDFVRIATNVIKEGKRAVGTVLDPAGAAYAAINKGEAYYGQVDILGKKYEAGYEPIKDAAGSVVGVLYVGFKI